MSLKSKIVARVVESDEFMTLSETFLNSSMGSLALEDYIDGMKLLSRKCASEIYHEARKLRESVDDEHELLEMGG